LYYEAGPNEQVGLPMQAVLEGVASDMAKRHGFQVVSREETKSDNGTNAILVWNLEEVK
jgi:hypothetical protein